MATILEKVVILLMVIAELFFPIHLVKANIQPKLKTEDVLLVQVNRLCRGTRVFKESDGYEKVIINKVVNWINTSTPSEGATELELNKTPIVSILKIKMKDGDAAVY